MHDATTLPLPGGDITARDIPWGALAPTPWPDARPIVAAALAHLPVLADDDAAALIEYLTLALADARDEREALCETLRAALGQLATAARDLTRVRERYHALLDQQRATRAA